ncbi:MAG: UDP-glucose/GDP-mannose dehydrogenase family protein [Deltaproteobacteria bacterium]|nr:UDP-glucose/GDP-mannose dehydrogenase family protein [Deltaproteobacteria bacterium]
MELTVIGTGYVGLVAGTCFAETGHSVACVDIDASKIAMLNRGEVPIYEPRLGELIEHNVKKGRLSFSTELAKEVRRAEVVFIAVGTPQDEDGSADLTHVLAVARAIGKALVHPVLVVTKSTVPVGTGEKVLKAIREESDVPVEIVSNPEFLKEGSAVDDFLYPDRIVIGCDSDHAKQVMGELYAPFQRTGDRVIFMDRRSAELTKYASNAMLATRISFMNEIANLAEKVGADVNKIRLGMGSDPRIGRSFLFPGVGYGGSCFPKDVRALMKTGEECGAPLTILGTVDDVNKRQKKVLVQKIVAAMGSDLLGKTFAIWGLAFKPQTDDMREAPAIDVIEGLLARGAKIRATDPEAAKSARRVFGDRIEILEDQYACLEGADALVLVTEWNEFRQPNFKRVKELLKQPYVFDGRNLYDKEHLEQLGFRYSGIGLR